MSSGKILRHSIAATGIPASDYDLQHYDLCRKTRLSHQFLVEQCAINGGNILHLAHSIGIRCTNTIYNADNRYWIRLCHILKTFIPEYEKMIRFIMSNDLSTIPQDELERIESFVGMRLETIQLLCTASETIDKFLVAIRPNLPRIAELNVARAIAESRDVKTSKWLLEHSPESPYSKKAIEDDGDITTIEVVTSNEQPPNHE